MNTISSIWHKMPFQRVFAGRFIYLLICMVLLFIIYPLLDYNNLLGQLIIETIYISILLACLRVVMHDTKSLRLSVYLLLAAAIAARLGGHLSVTKAMLVISLTVEIVFHLLLCIVIIGHVVKTEEVTADKVIGAVCAYLFIG
ncbi:MAG: hypothetical protein ABR497_12265, partial [Kiritimatiellia bacterium]